MVTHNMYVVGGSPTINNRRITVFNIVEGIFLDGDNYIQFLTEIGISDNDYLEALEYCRTLSCKSLANGNYCEQCALAKPILDKNAIENILCKMS